MTELLKLQLISRPICETCGAELLHKPSERHSRDFALFECGTCYRKYKVERLEVSAVEVDDFEDDPRELRKQLAEKNKRISELEKATSGFAHSTERQKQEVPALTDAYLTRLKARGLVDFSGRGTVCASAELFT
jgi:DNA-directed RNA polymerase subunit M/transcription elongation factor TFIIS